LGLFSRHNIDPFLSRGVLLSVCGEHGQAMFALFDRWHAPRNISSVSVVIGKRYNSGASALARQRSSVAKEIW